MLRSSYSTITPSQPELMNRLQGINDASQCYRIVASRSRILLIHKIIIIAANSCPARPHLAVTGYGHAAYELKFDSSMKTSIKAQKLSGVCRQCQVLSSGPSCTPARILTSPLYVSRRLTSNVPCTRLNNGTADHSCKIVSEASECEFKHDDVFASMSRPFHQASGAVRPGTEAWYACRYSCIGVADT